jgi:hypothetical protein
MIIKGVQYTARAESREGGELKMEPREGKVTATFVSLLSFYFCQKSLLRNSVTLFIVSAGKKLFI